MLDALPEGFDSGPVSYFQTDFLGESGHPFLISLHAVFMLTAWLGLLPLGVYTFERFASITDRVLSALALRNSRTSLSQLPRTFFMLANAIGILSAVFYQSHMPDLYAHSKHSLVAWISLAVALPILFPEPLMIASRFLKQSTWQSDGVNWDIEGFRWKPAEDSCTTPLLSRQATASLPISPTSQDPDPAEGSQISSGNTTALIILRNAFSLALVPLGWANALIGFAVYSGSCRTDHARGCFTHFTNGSFFILWGLFTFARYLGIGSHLSWCWNKPSSKSAITATSVESFALITCMPTVGESSLDVADVFVDGLVNLLMEMVGTPTDKPFTHHQSTQPFDFLHSAKLILQGSPALCGSLAVHQLRGTGGRLGQMDCSMHGERLPHKHYTTPRSLYERLHYCH